MGRYVEKKKRNAVNVVKVDITLRIVKINHIVSVGKINICLTPKHMQNTCNGTRDKQKQCNTKHPGDKKKKVITKIKISM